MGPKCVAEAEVWIEFRPNSAWPKVSIYGIGSAGRIWRKQRSDPCKAQQDDARPNLPGQQSCLPSDFLVRLILFSTLLSVSLPGRNGGISALQQVLSKEHVKLLVKVGQLWTFWLGKTTCSSALALCLLWWSLKETLTPRFNNFQENFLILSLLLCIMSGFQRQCWSNASLLTIPWFQRSARQ